MSQLSELATPFPARYIKTNPSGGGDYVKHHIVNQRLLMAVGPYEFERVEILRGHVDAIPPNPNGNSRKAKEGSAALDGAIVGVVCRLTCSIDDRRMMIEECGDCESPHNWPHDGARLKDAMSDAFKRCCMRMGLGLHLWSQEDYFLDHKLKERERPAVSAEWVKDNAVSTDAEAAGIQPMFTSFGAAQPEPEATQEGEG